MLKAATVVAAALLPVIAVAGECVAVPDAGETITKARATAKRAISQRLKDGASARFGKTLYLHERCDGADGKMVCGTVNARNGFGGYTGDLVWLVFLSDTKPIVWSEEDADETGRSSVWPMAHHCMENGK